MNDFVQIILFTGFAGLCIPLGGLLAGIDRFRPHWLEQELRHFVIAFGGGVLLAAVALVLIPEGLSFLRESSFGVLWLIAGGVLFFLLERTLGIRKREAPQFTAMLLDYIPESLAIGGIFASGSKHAPLLAILIGLQNLPEGFNAYRELHQVSGYSQRRVLIMMIALLPLGPLLALLGWYYLADQPDVIGAIMLVASGGILYLLFQDIAPQSRLERHWAPPLGAVAGFALGLLGQLQI